MSTPVTKARVIHIELYPLELKLWRYINTEPCTMAEMIQHLYGDNSDGGPLYPRNVIRSCISRINTKLDSTRIECRADLYQLVTIPPRFPKSTRRPRPVTLATLPWNKPR